MGSKTDQIGPTYRTHRCSMNRLERVVVQSTHEHVDNSSITKYFSRIQNGSDIRGVALDRKRSLITWIA